MILVISCLYAESTLKTVGHEIYISIVGKNRYIYLMVPGMCNVHVQCICAFRCIFYAYVYTHTDLHVHHMYMILFQACALLIATWHRLKTGVDD